MSEARPTPFDKPNDIECAKAAAALLRTAKEHDNPQPMSMNECTTVAALLDRLTLKLSESEERGEQMRAVVDAAIAAHYHSLTASSCKSPAEHSADAGRLQTSLICAIADFEDSARALNDIKEPKAKETESRPSDPKPPA